MLCLDIVSCSSITLQFRVVISGRGELPLIDEAGMNVQPNTATDIAMNHVSQKFSIDAVLNSFAGHNQKTGCPLWPMHNRLGRDIQGFWKRWKNE